MKQPLFRNNTTLRLSFPFGQTLILAGLIVLVAVIAGEAICRIPWVRDRLPAPSLDSNFHTLDVKIDLMNKLYDHEPIDCIFVGSSMVNRGIDVDVFEETYRQQTGESVNCFNFGLGGVTGSQAGVLAEYLVKTYHPALFVYGLSPRDFSPRVTAAGKDFMSTTWMQYAYGSFSIKGWLLHHSRLYGYALVYNTWMQPDFEKQLKSRFARADELAATGGQTSREPPAEPLTSLPKDQKNTLRSLFSNYAPVPADLDGLQRIINLQHPPERQIVLVEVPLYPTAVPDFIGVETYQKMMDDISQRARLQGVLMWPSRQLHLIPDNGWQNAVHLNTTGAEIFSKWLGEQMGQAVNKGDMLPFQAAK